MAFEIYERLKKEYTAGVIKKVDVHVAALRFYTPIYYLLQKYDMHPEQAEAYVELLDRLGINQVYVLSTSAGGSVAIRFALDYPKGQRE